MHSGNEDKNEGGLVYIISFECLKNKDSSCIYFPIESNIEILNIYYTYGYQSDCNTGYAHLLEHMVIKARQKEIDHILENSIQFNAVTKENTTEYTFINFRNDKFLGKHREKIVQLFQNIEMGNLEEKLLMEEKGTILEEFSILENRFSSEIAAKMLGGRKSIEMFSQEKMAEIYNTCYIYPKCIFLTGLDDIVERLCRIPKNMFYDFQRDILIKKNNSQILLKRCCETTIILFFLHICYVSQVLREWEVQISDEEEGIWIEVVGKMMIENKNLILNRYSLLCSNLKMYMEEVNYIVRNGLIELNIQKAFFDKWEGYFYE